MGEAGVASLQVEVPAGLDTLRLTQRPYGFSMIPVPGMALAAWRGIPWPLYDSHI